jgi:PAS domain S-box-containing protein
MSAIFDQRPEWKVLDYLPVGICIFDTDLRIRYWNRRLEDWTGIPADEIVGECITERFPGVNQPHYLERIRQVFTTSMPAIFSSQIHRQFIPSKRTDGTLQIQQTTVMALDRENCQSPYALVVIEDVTDLVTEVRAFREMRDRALLEVRERKKAEQALSEANEAANLYLDIMVHDINNANMVALGYCEMLSGVLDGEERELSLRIQSGTRQSMETIHNVSTIRRLREETLDLRRIDLDTAIRREIDQHEDVRIHYERTDATVLADDLVGVIFTNLIGNAAKFGGTGVEITISVKKTAAGVTISVEDTGPGIPDEEKRSIFNRFQKGKSSKSGKGLGLYICRALTERYGGRIWVEDRVPGRPSEGAAVRVTIPAAL